MKKGTLTNFLLILVLLLGLSLLLYPTFSEHWNAKRQTRVISTYSEEVAHLDEDKYAEVWDSAIRYNQDLLTRHNTFSLTEEQQAIYNGQLNVSGDGIMGYIEIPSINCLLPVYHTVEEKVLQTAVGHLEWTSLPTGGGGTHTVLSGHRGLPSARLFTDLDQLREGDRFMLHVLDELLTYEVDQILIVEPQETSALLIQPGMDLCTLVTCTPYGVNSHRLLIRGHRVANAPEAVVLRVTADAIQIEPLIVAPVIAGLLFAALFVLLGIRDRIKNH